MTFRPRFLIAGPLILASLVLLADCRDNRASARAPGPPPAPPRPQMLAFDAGLTDTARVLAGMPPSQPGAFASLTQTPSWREWRGEIDADWKRAETDRFAPMRAWRASELASLATPCETLFYPFSGPDLLNAQILFPQCATYVMFGLEHPGELPDLARTPADRIQTVIEDLQRALGDLLARNYFITRHMSAEIEATELKGVLPLVAVFLARLDARIIRIRAVEIDEAGALVERHGASPRPSAAQAVEVAFTVDGATAQTAVYFRAQAEDAGLPRHPGVVRYLEALAARGKVVTFLKSASYLLHNDQLSKMRALILDTSAVILQDDSAIPYRFLQPPAWKVTLYGRYQKPVQSFNYGFQADLDRAFAVPGAARALPFSFGYHWQTGSAAVMLAVRQTGADGAIR